MTLLIVFVIVVITVVVIFAYFNGLFNFVNPGKDSMAPSGLFALTGGGANTGDLAVKIMNTGHVAITGVTFACAAAQFASSNCDGLQLDLNAAVVSPQNPMGYDQTGSGSQLVRAPPGEPFIPGTIYTVTVTASLSDGTTLTETLSLAAQS